MQRCSSRSILRVISTYRTFSATTDEAVHVGGGLELYQYHRYQLHRIDPPEVRVVLAAAPMLGGMRLTPYGDYGFQLHSVFYGSGKYERNLFLARIGNTFFLILAAAALFACVRRETDDLAAVVVLFLFTFEPVILGHSGLATHDAAATAGLALSLVAFTSWLRKPTVGRAAPDAIGTISDETSTILLPIAGTAGDIEFPMGLRWRVQQVITNGGKAPVRIETNACARTALCSFDLAGGQSVAMRPPWQRPSYVILRANRNLAGQLRTSTVVERTDAAARGFRLPIPEVRVEEFARGSIVIKDIPVSPANRLNLRMWALDASDAQFTVKIVSGGAVIAQRSFATGRDGYVTEGDLVHTFPVLAGRELRADVVVTLSGADRLWAFITTTDNRTNLPRLLLPR